MKVLVTGGAGFIGHHLVGALVARGDDVRVLDDLSSGSLDRLRPLTGQFAFTDGSILDRGALAEAMDGCAVVFHQAALASVAASVTDPRRTNEINVTGTIVVMQAAAEVGVGRVVFAASSAAYGDTTSLPVAESEPPDPVSPYGASKVAAEHYLHSLGGLHGIATVALRYFNVFGPGQDPASEYAAVVPRFVTAVLEGRQPTIYGDGSASRDYTHIANVVQANLLAAADDGPLRLTCNIGTGSRWTLLELLDAITAAAGATAEPIFGPPRPGDVPHSQADISLAAERLGYRPETSFADGITQTVAWYRGQGTPAG